MRRSAGFTLIEVLAVLLLATIVLTFAVRFFMQANESSQAAIALGAESQRTALLLDTVARDLEAVILVSKPDGVDPLEHPWVFLGEARSGGLGSDQLKLQARNHRPLRRAGSDGDASNTSDLQVIAYWLTPGDGAGYELRRFASPALPERLDRSFPRSDDDGVLVLARDVAAFGVRWMADDGSWVDEWDSSTLARSNQLPLAAEISLALLLPEEPEGPEPEPSVRQLLIPTRPIDLTPNTDAADDEEEDDEDDESDPDCVTVSECLERNPGALESYLDTLAPEVRSSAELTIQSLSGQCFSEQAGTLGLDLEGCE